MVSADWNSRSYSKRKGMHFGSGACSKKFRPSVYSSYYLVRPLSTNAVIFSANSKVGNVGHQMKITPGKIYTFGRSNSTCDCIFLDSRVSRQHCQLYCYPDQDDQNKSFLFVVDGTLLNNCLGLFQNAIRDFVSNNNNERDEGEFSIMKYVKPSLNGTYVNGTLMKLGHSRILSVGDEVSFVSHHKLDPTFTTPVGFVVDGFEIRSFPGKGEAVEANPNLETGISNDKNAAFLTRRLLESSVKLRQSLLPDHLDISTEENFHGKEEKVDLSTQLGLPTSNNVGGEGVELKKNFQKCMVRGEKQEQKGLNYAYSLLESQENVQMHNILCSCGICIKTQKTIHCCGEVRINSLDKRSIGALSTKKKSEFASNFLPASTKSERFRNGSLYEGDKHVEELISRASLLLRKCREILTNKDRVVTHTVCAWDSECYSMSSPQLKEVCAAGEKTQTAEDVDDINDAYPCQSNMEDFKHFPDVTGTSVLILDAANINQKLKPKVIDAKNDEPQVNCKNEFDSILNVPIAKEYVGMRTVDWQAVSSMQQANEVIFKDASVHTIQTFECCDNNLSNANKVVSTKEYEIICSEAREARLHTELCRLENDKFPILGNKLHVVKHISCQDTVDDGQTSTQQMKRNFLCSLNERKGAFRDRMPSATCKSYKNEELEKMAKQDNVSAESVKKSLIQNNEQKENTVMLETLNKNSSNDYGNINGETRGSDVERPIIDNACKKVSLECEDKYGQQELTISTTSKRYETVNQICCSTANICDTLNFMQVQSEAGTWDNANRLSSEAVPCPPNEEHLECQNANVIVTDEAHSVKQALLRERSIIENFSPSNEEVDQMMDNETNVMGSDSLLEDKYTEMFDSKINSVDGERRKDTKYLNQGEVESLKDSSINDPVLFSGKAFCLNNIEFMQPNSGKHQGTVSLQDLLVPLDNLLGILCTTFTSDILWFLSYCKIPSHLPVTIVCHNSERCWSTCNDQRWSRPYADWPNLTVVYPPFPEAVTFGKGPRQGIGCHHSKMFLLYRKESIRIVITSANLSARQWHHVTNTVWWQDFPRRSTPDYISLFICPSSLESNNIKADFAAQLAGFIATFISYVPTEAHWVSELANYDFSSACGYLLASVPGIHGCLHPHPRKHGSPKLSNERFANAKYLGILPTSVVGLSYRFSTAADPKGERLKLLATLLNISRADMDDMMPVLLRRTINVSADPNAISVIIYNISGSSEDILQQEDASHVHLGFLPKDVAKWIAPLWDAGIFTFSAYICPQEALATASGKSNKKVQLILYVFSGKKFVELSSMPTCNQHSISLCNLLGSLQRPYGLWRLQEVLSQYKWPNSVETDFLYGSSSIGMSLDAHFLAAFSAASGRKSIPSSCAASDETDPEMDPVVQWGCWNAQLESEDPSIGIVFPTIKRVKSGKDGILPYSHLLCFAESTWQRLKSANLLHDAIPYPTERVGFPMHTKVARRRFQYSSNMPSFGWIYCGSHNFSPAAWGRPLFKPLDSKAATSSGSVLGSSLHIYNYEIGLVFIVPPPENPNLNTKDHEDLDNFILPFVVPAPKYQESDQPATKQAMREARIEMLSLQKINEIKAVECLELVTEESALDKEVPIEDAQEELLGDVLEEEEEKEEDQVYAETLWSQVDSCHI